VPYAQPAGTVATATRLHHEGVQAYRQGHTAAAIALLERALEVWPEFTEAHNNLGVLLQAEGRLAEAIPRFEQAVAANPAYLDALNNLAMALFALDRFEAAIAHWGRVLTLAPGHRGAEVCISKALYGLSMADAEGARRLARAVLADHPESPVIRHGVAGIIGEVTPDRAETGYVTALFDFFAGNFDDALGRLNYSPRTLVAMLAHEWTATNPLPADPGPDLLPDILPDILDAGCGTGLAAGFLRPLAGTLTGCDLSRRMLEQARATGHYDHLIEAELVGFLRTHPECFHMVVAADVLVYFGALHPVFAAVRTALRPGGLFACSMEGGDDAPSTDAGFVLASGGRYKHTSRYLREVAASTGFEVRQLLPETQRWEVGEPIPGLKLVARKE